MLIDFLVISLLIGLLRKGKLLNFAHIPLEKIELIILSFLLRYLPLVTMKFANDFTIKYNIVFASLSYLLLIYSLYCNWHIKPFRLIALGVILNFVVILANGGKMPVSLSAVDIAGLHDFKPLLFDEEYLYHAAINSATNLTFLSDIIPLPPPYPRPRVFSIGDLAMGIGMFMFIQQAMLKKWSTDDKII